MPAIIWGEVLNDVRGVWSDGRISLRTQALVRQWKMEVINTI